MAPGRHGIKDIGRYFLRCQALELGKNGQMGLGMIRMVKQTRPLCPEQQTVELEGGTPRVDVDLKFEAMASFIHCLSQGVNPLVRDLSDSLGDEAMLFCRDKECTGKEIATWQHPVFNELQP